MNAEHVKILFTGGGSAGHVTPNLALMDEAGRRGFETVYVGSADGIEREIVGRTDVAYRVIRSGKLRRYFSWQNFIDPFNVLIGVTQAMFVVLRERPDVVFSKGGFVAVPVVLAAWVFRIPVVCHESDIVPGLANRLCQPFSRLMCVNFPETAAYLKRRRVEVTGTPLRDGIVDGNAASARARLGIADDRRVLLAFGGSLGAARINAAVADAFEALADRYDVIHVTGEEGARAARPGYHPFAYVHEGFGDLLALADVVVSRAGANSLYELLVLNKPHVLVPLPATSSRGDQLVNADVMARGGYSVVVADEDLDATTLIEAVRRVEADRAGIMAALETFPAHLDGAVRVVDLLAAAARR